MRGIGTLTLIGGMVTLIAGLSADHGERSAPVLAGIALVLSSCFYLVLAGLREAAERAAFHARRSADALEEIASRGVSTAPPASSTQPLNLVGSKLDKSRLFYVKFPDGGRFGPLDVSEMQALLNEGRINSETPALRATESEWKTLGAFIAS
jgi:hypothetical protein